MYVREENTRAGTCHEREESREGLGGREKSIKAELAIYINNINDSRPALGFRVAIQERERCSLNFQLFCSPPMKILLPVMAKRRVDEFLVCAKSLKTKEALLERVTRATGKSECCEEGERYEEADILRRKMKARQGGAVTPENAGRKFLGIFQNFRIPRQIFMEYLIKPAILKRKVLINFFIRSIVTEISTIKCGPPSFRYRRSRLAGAKFFDISAPDHRRKISLRTFRSRISWSFQLRSPDPPRQLLGHPQRMTKLFLYQSHCLTVLASDSASSRLRPLPNFRLHIVRLYTTWKVHIVTSIKLYTVC